MDSSKDSRVKTSNCRKRRQTRRKRFWCQDWFKKRNKISQMNLYSELKFAAEEWHDYLGMNEETYSRLLSLVTPIIQRKDTIMRAAISPHERLMATLRYLATGQCMEHLKSTTSISPQSLGQIIPETCEAIYKVLHKDYLKFPKTEEEWKAIAHEFEERWHFPHCLGAMDAKHICFNPPGGSGGTFLNRKGRHSMVLLGIANAKCEFILCDFGTNGRLSDAGVLGNTRFFEKLLNRTLNIPESSRVGDRILPFVFVVDGAFPLRREMMKPFRQLDLTSDRRETYNSRVSSVRRIAENVFEVLASRFRILQTVLFLQPQKIESIVMACCVLHNFLSRSAPSFYPPPDGFDRELMGSSTAVLGQDTSNSSMIKLDENLPGNSAEIVREKFVNYFVTNGQVP